MTFAGADREGRFDSAGGGEEELLALDLVAGAQHVGERADPEVAFEWALGADGAIDAVGHHRGVGLGADELSRGDERGEHLVAGFEAEQAARDAAMAEDARASERRARKKETAPAQG